VIIHVSHDEVCLLLGSGNDFPVLLVMPPLSKSASLARLKIYFSFV
jgi:hypothetical protein